ncbi:MAG TPA: cytochrome c, partial [Bacillota bacterium]|nr:cytochrome c [Bacillota bacterium]
MKRNPAFGYGIIAVLGIVLMIVIAFVGVDMRDKAAQEAEQGTEQTAEEGEVSSDPEAIYANNCAACHGADLSGGAGPELANIGSKYSPEELAEIIQNGIGTMPAQSHIPAEEVSLLSEWL